MPRSRHLIACLIVTLGAGGWALAQQPSAVTVAPVEKKPIALVSRLVATVEPMVRSTLAAEQAALVRERYFDEGQEVEKGALLAKFDDSLLQRRLASLQAQARSAEAELRRAQLVEQNDSRERDRVTGLYEQGAANEKEYYDAINAHEQSEAAVAVAEALVAERAAAIEELSLEIEKTNVFAPFTGVVNRRYVEVGQWVQQGEPVAEMVQLDPLYVRTGVPESVVSLLARGMTASFTVDALGGRPFEGTIAEILPVADVESRTFPVRLRVENKDRALHPGMFARATFSQENDAWLVVPKDAVTRFRGQTMVVLADNGMSRNVPVTLGAADETSVAVTGEGLKEGDLVVVRGNEGLMDGTPLMITNPPGGGGGPPGGPPGGGPPGQGQAGQGEGAQQGGPPGGGAGGADAGRGGGA
jgi:membrane fusion protein (multidrug efflux system)